MEKAYYDREIKSVIVKFSGTPNLEEFKLIANSINVELEKHKAYKTLNDTTDLTMNKVENQEWTKTEWFPKAEKAGLKYYAFVLAKDIFGQVTAEQTNEKAEDEGNIEFAYFDSMEDARNWLASK